MIELTRLNGDTFLLNAELIEQMDSTPDTVITLTTGNNIVVREKVAVVLDKIMTYRQKMMVSRQQHFEEKLDFMKGAA